jgi:hypothetical protein
MYVYVCVCVCVCIYIYIYIGAAWYLLWEGCDQFRWLMQCRLLMKCDGTCAETRFRHSARNGPSPFKSAGGGRQLNRLLAAEVCGISSGNAGYTVFRGSVKGTGYPLHSPVSPFTSPTVRHRVPSHFNWSLLILTLLLHRASILSCLWTRQVSLYVLRNESFMCDTSTVITWSINYFLCGTYWILRDVKEWPLNRLRNARSGIDV